MRSELLHPWYYCTICKLCFSCSTVGPILQGRGECGHNWHRSRAIHILVTLYCAYNLVRLMTVELLSVSLLRISFKFERSIEAEMNPNKSRGKRELVLQLCLNIRCLLPSPWCSASREWHGNALLTCNSFKSLSPFSSSALRTPKEREGNLL